MKLAEALQLRADLKKEIEQIRFRLVNNALVQEGEKPAEDPNELLKKLDNDIKQLNEITVKINLTNCATEVDGQTLTELISQKDALTTKISLYQEFSREASRTVSRATRSEIKICSSVDVSLLVKQIDKMSKQLRLLDNKIQSTNWTVELK